MLRSEFINDRPPAKSIEDNRLKYNAIEIADENIFIPDKARMVNASFI